MLGVLLLIYVAAGYVFFWSALGRVDPHATAWINFLSVMAALLIGPLMFLIMFLRALLNPRYQPVHVVLLPVGAETDGRYQVDWKGIAE